MSSLLPSITILGVAALGALALTRLRPASAERVVEYAAASRSLAVATAMQAVHFVEEAATGFHQRLGDVFGVPDIPFPLFVTFNLLWIGIWVASVPGIRSRRAWAFFAAWFLAIAGMINGVAHPLLAIATGGYFPGLVSAPLVAAACVWLTVRLTKATRSAV